MGFRLTQNNKVKNVRDNDYKDILRINEIVEQMNYYVYKATLE